MSLIIKYILESIFLFINNIVYSYFVIKDFRIENIKNHIKNGV